MRMGFGNVIALALVVSTGGCGLYTPDFQEFWGTPDDADTKVKLVVREVECELKRAFSLEESWDIQHSKELGTPRTLDFLEGWLVDAAFLFTIEEKSTVNPGVSLNTPMASATSYFAHGATVTTPQSFSLGLGGLLSSDAYRQEKFHIPYLVSALVGPEKDLPPPETIQQKACETANADGSLFLQSDFKLDEWLRRIANVQRREQGNFNVPDAFATSGASVEDVRFEIVSSGNITPTWKLVRVSADPNTTLFNTSRDRTQEVILTMGPTNGKGQLTGAGQNAALAAEIGAAVAQAIKGSASP